MKVGDKVVCIKRGDWVFVKTGIKDVGTNPKFGDELVVSGFDGISLMFLEYPKKSYQPRWFRPIEPAKSNSVTRKIVEDFKKSEKQPEYNPMEVPQHLELKE